MIYTLIYTKRASKDIQNLKAAKLSEKARILCESLTTKPFPSFSKQLSGDLKGRNSIRINLQHRLVYEVDEGNRKIKILSMWSHYE